jgi:eukaryotic-like serine/threonine-protein kinase
MEVLERALHAAQNGAGGCILLAGEAGIGKSRLAAELGERASSTHFWILQGYCSEQDSSFPYGPWIDALRSFLAPRNAAELNELLGAFAPELVKLLPELSLLMPSVQPTPPLDPEAEKHRLFETLTRFVVSLAAAHTLWVFHDKCGLSTQSETQQYFLGDHVNKEKME